MRSAKPTTRTWIALSLVAWVLLTALGTVLHHRIWSAELEPGAVGVSNSVQSIGNVVHVLVCPGWLLIRFFSRGWPTGAWSGPLLANAVGWSCWIAGVWLLIGVRRWILQRKTVVATEAAPAVPREPNLSRRRFLVDGSLIAAAAGGASLLVKGEFLDAWGLQIVRYRIPIADLPPGLDGLRAVLLADTHLGPRVPADYIRHAVQMALDLNPDLFLLGGDYIHNGASFIEPAAALFEPLIKSSRPVVAVRGNHDWYADGHAMGRALEAIGVRVIDNRRVYLDGNSRRVVSDEPAAGSLALVGLGDVFTDLVDASMAFGGLRDEIPRVVLAHNPDTAEVLAGRLRIPQTSWSKGYVAYSKTPRIDAMLCGHTHGGQVRIPFLGTPIIPCMSGTKYAGGLIRGPGYPVIVSRGVGMSILPIRLGVPPEVVEVTFVRA